MLKANENFAQLNHQKQHSEKATLYAKPLLNVLSHLFSTRLKSQVHHWNVHGVQFYALHKLLEEIYRSLDDSIDEVAERIRTMGIHTIASFEEITRFAGPLNKSSDKFMNMEQTIEDMNDSFQKLSDSIVAVLQQKDLECKVTEDLLVGILGKTEKFGWMIRSSSQT